MMNVDDIRYLFEYDAWANARAFDASSSLSEEQFASVHDTLTHIVAVEWIWLERVRGTNPQSAPEWTRDATLQTLRERLTVVEHEWRDFLAALADDDLQRRVDYVRFNGEAGSRKLVHLLQHVVNHSTYHRGQVATRIRQAGGVPLETDFLHFTV